MVNDDERTDDPAPEEAEEAATAEPHIEPVVRPQRPASRRTIARDDRRRRSARKGSRRRWVIGIGGGSIALMLIAGLFLPSVNLRSTTALDQGDDAPLAGTAVPVQTGGIIDPGASHDAYSTLPPTSGPRYAEPAPWGVHEAQVADETVVRNLEVGAVVFNYNLESEAEVTDLRQLVEALPGYPGCYLMHPYAGVPSGSVTLTAWGWTQQVAGVDRFLIQTFANDHLNDGPQHLDLSCGAPPATPTPELEQATPTADAQQGE
ncbi:MAG: DUF3105 domain-containing protein [Chloroflexi bacterium]|nr:DUF3105 domain-containing protein [Chloroflexota bacterium]